MPLLVSSLIFKVHVKSTETRGQPKKKVSISLELKRFLLLIVNIGSENLEIYQDNISSIPCICTSLLVNLFDIKKDMLVTLALVYNEHI